MPRRLDLLILPGFFLFCALPVLLFVALWVPTGESPDEVAHIVRMESVLHRQWVGHRAIRLDATGKEVADSGVRGNASLLFAGFSFQPGTPVVDRVMTKAREEALARYQWEPGSSFISVPNTGVYPPFLYVPGAVGMQLAKWMGHGPWEAIRWARVVNVLTYAALGALALLVARRVRGAFLALLLLPMSLWLASTCTQDGIVIGLSLLGAALLTRGSAGAWWGCVACLALVCVAKPLYLPLAGVMLALAPGRDWLLGQRALGAACVGLPAAGWYVFAQAMAGVAFVRTPSLGGPFWYGDPAHVFGTVDPALQVQVLLRHPSLMLRLPLSLFQEQGGWLFWEAIGLLGTLDVLMPLGVYALWSWALAALVVGEPLGGRLTPPGKGFVASLVVWGSVVTTVFALCVGQYLSWTATGAAAIEGVQGRYFIPVVAFAALALPVLRVPGAAAWRWGLRLPLAVAGLAGIVVVPGVVVSTYYLR